MQKQIINYLLLFLTYSLRITAAAQSPSVEILSSGTKTSLRGLSVVNDNVIWVSGSAGMVGRSLNGGKNWTWFTVKGFEKTEFRDIEAFDGQTAIIMGIAEPAYILKTTDGGETWKVVYENKTRGMFLDAMDFEGPTHGIVVGDPIDGKIFVAETFDGGDNWKQLDFSKPYFKPKEGEAFFAASGTNIKLRGDHFVMVSGGTASNLYKSYFGKSSLPVTQGKETTGANSIDVHYKKISKIIIVGGDFNKPDLADSNCVYSNSGGTIWKKPKIPPHGYRSCVEYLSEKDVVCCGLNGVDYSGNGGKTWTWISKEGFNTCRIAKTGVTVFLVGNNGKIAKLKWE